MTLDTPQPAPGSQEVWPSSRHGVAAARSLAMHILVAGKITANPALLDAARAVMERWSAPERRGLDHTAEWREILQRPWPEIAALITDPGAEGTRLRKSGPFAVLLEPAEREAIFERFKPASADDLQDRSTT